MFRMTVFTALKPRGQKALIVDMLKATEGNVTEAAKRLDVAREYLHRRMTVLGIDAAKYRVPSWERP